MNKKFQKIKKLISATLHEANEPGVKIPVQTAMKMNPDTLGKMAKNTNVTITDSIVNENISNIVPAENVKPGDTIYNDGEVMGTAVVVTEIGNWPSLIKYDEQDFLPNPDDFSAVQQFQDQFSPDDHFVVIQIGSDRVIGYYGPNDFYALDSGIPGRPNDKVEKPSEGGSGSTQTMYESNDRDYKEEFIAKNAFALNRADQAKYELADLDPKDVASELIYLPNTDIDYLYNQLKASRTIDLPKQMNDESVVVTPSKEFNKVNHLIDIADPKSVEAYIDDLLSRFKD